MVCGPKVLGWVWSKPVVEGDEGEDAGAAGQGDVAAPGCGSRPRSGSRVRSCGRGGRRHGSATSCAVVGVVGVLPDDGSRPCRCRCTSRSGRSGPRGAPRTGGRAGVIRRTPEEASGWPVAMAPPYWLTRGSSSAMPKWSRKASTWTANASLSSNRPMSSMVRPALAQRLLGGRDRADAHDLGLDADEGVGRPGASAPAGRARRRPRSEASRHAVAPSLRPAALPAVTLPCGAERGLERGRGPRAWCRGAAARRRWRGPSPSRRGGSPPARGRAGSCRRRRPWPACPGCRRRYASERSLVSCGKRSCRFSAVLPMTRADGSTIRSETMRGLGSTPSPIGWRPMCSTPPAMATSMAPNAIERAVVGDGGHRAGAHPVDGVAGRGLRQAGEQRGQCGRGSGPGRRSGWSRRWPPPRPAPWAARGCGAAARGCSLMTRSSARVWAYMPFSPALPNGVRTPSTKTTSWSARGTGGLLAWWAADGCTGMPVGCRPMLLAGNSRVTGGRA